MRPLRYVRGSFEQRGLRQEVAGRVAADVGGVRGQVEQLVLRAEHDLDLLDRAAVALEPVVDAAADEPTTELGERPLERRRLRRSWRSDAGWRRRGPGQFLEARDDELGSGPRVTSVVPAKNAWRRAVRRSSAGRRAPRRSRPRPRHRAAMNVRVEQRPIRAADGPADDDRAGSGGRRPGCRRRRPGPAARGSAGRTCRRRQRGRLGQQVASGLGVASERARGLEPDAWCRPPRRARRWRCGPRGTRPAPSASSAARAAAASRAGVAVTMAPHRAAPRAGRRRACTGGSSRPGGPRRHRAPRGGRRRARRARRCDGVEHRLVDGQRQLIERAARWAGSGSRRGRRGTCGRGGHPSDPSISSFTSRLNSMAYSIGSSLVKTSRKPWTMRFVASFSVRPRLIR